MKLHYLFSLFALFIAPFCEAEAKTLKVGVTAGPHAVIMEQVKKQAKAKGLDIEIVEFSDFILPNEALNIAELDINCYQHEPFLKQQIKDRGYKIKAIGYSVRMPLGVYGRKIKKLKDLPSKARVAIPNDPTNEARALRLLEHEGLIKLKNDVEMPSLLDIKENSKNLNFIEMDAPFLPKALEDNKTDIAIINTDWILVAGLNPHDAIAWEPKDSPYANVIAVRENEQREEIKQFVQIYQSKETKAFIKKTYGKAILPAW